MNRQSSIVNRQSPIARCSKPRKPRKPRLTRSLTLPACTLYLVFCVLCLGSCTQLSSVDPNYVNRVAQEVNDLVVRVDAYQQAATVTIEQLSALGAIDPNKASKILAANADVDRLQATIQQVVAALQKADYSDSQGLFTLIQSAQAANSATAPWNPYSGPIAAALTIISIILGIILRKKTAQAAALALKYQAHKQGVEKTMKEVSLASDPEIAKVEVKLYENIGAARSTLGVT